MNAVMTLAEWQRTIKPVKHLLLQSSPDDHSDRWVSFPIGTAYGYMDWINDLETVQLGAHTELVACNFALVTDRRRRGSQPVNRATIATTLGKNGFKLSYTKPEEYFTSLPNYKFVCSPEGNGIDCHRHYEALLAGCIPIVEDCSGIREKYRGCPVLYTKDYSEITATYLETVYESMREQTYDFSRMFIESYSSQEVALIKRFGNYWCKKFKKTLPYASP